MKALYPHPFVFGTPHFVCIGQFEGIKNEQVLAQVLQASDQNSKNADRQTTVWKTNPRPLLF
jgi:hypothetical protein